MLKTGRKVHNPAWTENRFAFSLSKVALILASPSRARHEHRSPKAYLSKQQGFTLLELLISFSLVIFLIAGTAQVAVHSILVQKQGEANLRSLELACSKLEYFKSLPFESEELEAGFETEDLNQNGSLETYKREWKIEDISGSLKKIEVTCFSLACPKKRTRLALYLLRELGF